MDLQALLQMFLESENAPGNTLSLFTEKIKAFAAERGFEITDEQIAKGLEVMQKLYGQYQRGEEMDMASVASAFMGDSDFSGLANMFMGGEGGADMMQMLGQMNAQQGGGMDLGSMAQMMMGAQGGEQNQNADIAQLASMFLNKK